MRIVWSIAKQRGNHRPVLRYEITLDEHEIALAVPVVRIESTIPEPRESWRPCCLPGEFERAGCDPASFRLLDTPSHAQVSCEASLRLPWREDNFYPEVEESMRMLRQAFEQAVSEAHASEPMNEAGELRGSLALRREMAPDALARRLLQLTG